VRLCFFADGRNVHAQHVASGLAARGHVVHVVTHKPVPVSGVTVTQFCVPQASLRHPLRWPARLDRYLRNFLDTFDVVILYFLADYGFTPEILEEGCFVASPRGSDIVPPPGEGPPSEDLVKKRMALLRSAAAVGVAGPRFGRIVARYAQMDEAGFVRLPLGVDTGRFIPRKSSGRSDGVRRVGFLKGFREVYGAIDLIQAIPRILEACPGTEFELVGEGPTLQKCQVLAQDICVQGSIRWTPRRPHSEVPAILSEWDVSVMPSKCESFGLAALESSACEVPVVAYNVGGIPDTVQDGETGNLVAPNSVDSLAERVIALLGDDTLRRRLGRAGRQFVIDRFEWRNVLQRWESSLEEVRERRAVMA